MCSQARRRPHLSIMRVAWRVPGTSATSSRLVHSGQWPQPVPPSPDTWFCSCVDVACCSLSRTASLSHGATSSSCSWAFSSAAGTWPPPSYVHGRHQAAPDRLEAPPAAEGRPPMSKVAADQQGSRGYLVEEREPVMAGWTTGMGSGCKQRRQRSWARAGQQQELAGAGGLVGGASGPAFGGCFSGSFWWVELPGPGVRKATSTHYSPKACVLGLMGNILSMASLQGPAVEDAPLATPVVSPENTILGGKSFLYTPKPSPE